MKKMVMLVFIISLFVPSVSFAQHKESKKEKIARLEMENAALKAENALYQKELEQAKHHADSITGVAAKTDAQLQVLTTQHKALQEQNKQLKAKGDSLTKVNMQLEKKVKAQAAASKTPKAIPLYATNRCKQVCETADGCDYWARETKKGNASFQIVNVDVTHTPRNNEFYDQVVKVEYTINGQKFTKQFNDHLRKTWPGFVY